MDTIQLKQYIFENKLIEFVLEKIGNTNIVYHSNRDYYSCCNYNGDRPDAVNVRNNKYLNVINWTRQDDFNEKSDIITLVEYNMQCDFIKAIKYLHEILGLEYKYTSKPKSENKKDPLEIFKKAKSINGVCNVSDLNVLDENILTDYVPYIHISWFREGVMPWTVKKFGLGYSYRQKRVIIPMRYWLTGELLGINSRTTVENYELFGIKKFFITPTYPKRYNLFGLYENYDSIKKVGYVVIYESEKSVLKRHSLNDGTGVALSGHIISDEQVRILIGLNVDIIISLDNDIPLTEIRNMCSKFYRIRNVYYTYDKYKLLREKDSIADAKGKIFNYLMKYKIKYDAVEHGKYLRSLKNEKNK